MIARVVAAALALGLVGAGPAAAADPYVPFPEEDPLQRAHDTVTELNDRLLGSEAPLLSIPQLEGGILLRHRRGERPSRGGGTGRTQVLPAHAASPPGSGDSTALFERAGVDGPTDPSTLGGWWLLVLAGLLGLAAVAFELRGGRLHHSS